MKRVEKQTRVDALRGKRGAAADTRGGAAGALLLADIVMGKVTMSRQNGQMHAKMMALGFCVNERTCRWDGHKPRATSVPAERCPPTKNQTYPARSALAGAWISYVARNEIAGAAPGTQIAQEATGAGRLTRAQRCRAGTEGGAWMKNEWSAVIYCK